MFAQFSAQGQKAKEALHPIFMLKDNLIDTLHLNVYMSQSMKKIFADSLTQDLFNTYLLLSLL